MKYTKILSFSLIAFLATSVQAEEKKDSPWKNEAELGFLRTTGNTENESVNAKFDSTYEVEKWRHNIHAEAYGQRADDATTGQSVRSAERYELSGQSDYKFTEHDYAFGLVKFTRDHFSGFEYEHTLSLGYGRKAIKQDDMELDLEIGPGARFYKVDNAAESEEEGVLRLAGKYWWQITDTSKFTQDLSFDIGEEYTLTESISGIQANINSTLALKFTYTIRNKSEVPAGIEKTDTEAAMTLVYSY